MQFRQGKPCKKCGGTERYRSNRKCVRCARESARRARQDDPDGHIATQTRYRRNRFLRRATPSWVDEGAIERIYRERDLLAQQMNMEFEVAHDVPIRGRTVCGLHVHWNLKVVSKSWLRIRRFNQKKTSDEHMKWLVQHGLAVSRGT